MKLIGPRFSNPKACLTRSDRLTKADEDFGDKNLTEMRLTIKRRLASTSEPASEKHRLTVTSDR